MFIRIGENRIKLASIGEFTKKSQSTSTGQWYLSLKVSGKERLVAFATEKELNDVVEYLDRVLKVQVV
jgi:hypothetical protein